MSLTELQISAARVARAEGEEGVLRGWVSRLMGGGGGGSEGRVTLLPPLPEEKTQIIDHHYTDQTDLIVA